MMDRAFAPISSVNCRIGSLEIVWSITTSNYNVNCRIGSLESRKALV